MEEHLSRKRILFIGVCFTFMVLGESAENKLPSYIEVCRRNDPKVEECILNSVEKLRPTLMKGIPELEVPPLDPLHIPNVKVSMAGSTSFTAVGQDVIVHGASNFHVHKLKVNLEKHEFAVSLELPGLYFEGLYDVNGQFVVLPVQGRGPIRCNATKINGELLLKGRLDKREKGEYIHFTAVEVDLQIHEFTVRVQFNGDTILTEATNAAISANPQEFLNSMLPVVELTVGNVLLDIANKITKNFTYDELFPKD